MSTETPPVTLSGEIAARFLENWADSLLAGDLGGKLTCSEAEALADLLSELGAPGSAAVWIECHAETDEEGDDHYDPLTPTARQRRPGGKRNPGPPARRHPQEEPEKTRPGHGFDGSRIDPWCEVG